MSEYGLPTKRDESGNLEAVDHTYQWGGDEVTIKLVPPTISQQEEYENLDEDTSSSELTEIVDRHLVEPDTSEMELTARELLCYVQGIYEYSVGEAEGMASDVQAELDERAGDGGN